MLRERPTEGSQKQALMKYIKTSNIQTKGKNQNQNLDVTGEAWQTVNDAYRTRMMLLLICAEKGIQVPGPLRKAQEVKSNPTHWRTFLTSSPTLFLPLFTSSDSPPALTAAPHQLSRGVLKSCMRGGEMTQSPKSNRELL